MKHNRLFIIGALVVGLIAGIVAGPTLSTATASAQIATLQRTGVAGPNGALWNSFLDQLAAALNIQRTALDSAMTTAGNSTIDAAVQQGTLTQAEADALKARIQSGDLGALWGGGHGRGRGMPAIGGIHQAMVDAAAATLGISSDELFTQLRDGATLTEIAQANGTTAEAVTNAALAAAKTALNQAVAAGTLTQTQADSMYTQLEQKGEQLFTMRGRGPGDRGRGPGERGQFMDPNQPKPTATPSSTT